MASSLDDTLLKRLSNSIKEFVAPDAEGHPTTHCFIMRTGFSIDPEDYNPDKKNASLNLASLFNDIPKISAAWQTSGKRVSTLWNILLTTGKAPLSRPKSDEEKKRYEEAIKKLYGSQEKFDNLEKSAFYLSVDKARKALIDAQFQLYDLEEKIKNKIGKDADQAEFNKMYQRMSPPYVSEVTSKREEYILRQREVARYTTSLFTYNTGSLADILNNFGEKMERYKRTTTDEEEFYQVEADPSNWWTYFKGDYKPVDGWTQVTVNQNYSSTSSRDTYTKIGGGVNYIFFSFEASGGRRVTTTSEHAKGLSISFKVKVVDIRRPWMDTALLDYDCLSLSDAKEGQWSTGEMNPENLGSFPLLPTSMVLATDIKVTATSFSSDTEKVFEEYSASGSGIWNLLCFGASGSHTSESSSATWNKETKTMTISGVQIIGYSCSLIPFFPKSTGNEMQ